MYMDAVLDVTPNDLLMLTEGASLGERERWLSRLTATARKLGIDDLRLAVRQIEALSAHREAKQSEEA